jgi:Ran GTPase-activating protein (RanGAP) involved in mRNA processing and transport
VLVFIDTSQFVPFCQHNQVLTSLNLSSNNIGPDGSKCLAEGLKNNHSLVTLDLRDNHIGTGGGKILLEALRTNTTLERLGVGKTLIPVRSFLPSSSFLP